MAKKKKQEGPDLFDAAKSRNRVNLTRDNMRCGNCKFGDKSEPYRIMCSHRLSGDYLCFVSSSHRCDYYGK